MCNIRCGSYKQKRFGLGYSALYWRIYAVFCLLDIQRNLDQPSKLHHPPLHVLACSTTFSWRKIKKRIFTITIGFLAPLVLENAYACIQVLSAARAWPPNYPPLHPTSSINTKYRHLLIAFIYLQVDDHLNHNHL